MKKIILTLKLLGLILKYNVIQSKIGRRLLGGKFFLIRPSVDGVGDYWVTEAKELFGDTIIREENYERLVELK